MRLPIAAKALLAVPLILGLSGCYTSNDTDEVAVHVTGYKTIRTDRHPDGCIAASKTKRVGLGDKGYKYFAGQRSYKIGGSGADHEAIVALSKDSARITFTGGFTFYLIDSRLQQRLTDQDCTLLTRFHQQIGTKRWGDNHVPAYINEGNDVSGWDAMLDFYLGQSAQNCLTDLTLSDGALEIAQQASKRQELQTKLQQCLPTAVKGLAHSPYFVGFTVRLNKPTIPNKLQAALEENLTIKQEQKNVSADNAKRADQYTTFADCKGKGLSEQSCILIYGINQGRINVLPIPEGASIAANGR